MASDVISLLRLVLDLRVYIGIPVIASGELKRQSILRFPDQGLDLGSQISSSRRVELTVS